MSEVYSAVASLGQSLSQHIVAEYPLSPTISAWISARICNPVDEAKEGSETPDAYGVWAASMGAVDPALSLLGKDGVKKSSSTRPHALLWHGGKAVASKADSKAGGRGRYKPVHRFIEAEDDFANEQGWYWAAKIGRPLNRAITLNLPHILDAMSEDRPALWRAEITAIRNWLAKQGEKLTLLWNRSSIDKEGNGEHLHALVHIPARLTAKFAKFLENRYGGRPAVVWKVADQHWWQTKSGRMQSAFNYYIGQGIEPKRAWGLNRKYHPAGCITGKRCGFSDDISPLAIADAYRVAGQVPPEWTRPWVGKSKAKRASNDNAVPRRSRLLVGHSEAVIAPSLEGRAGGGKKPTKDNSLTVSGEDAA